MKVKDVMHKGVNWVSPDTPVTELAKLMRENRRHSDWITLARQSEKSAHSLPLRTLRRCLGSVRHAVLGKRTVNIDPFARLARHDHVPTHHARELAVNSEPGPRSPEVLRGRGIGLGEFFEQFRLLLCRITR